MYDRGYICSLCICITSIWLEIKPNSAFTYAAEGLCVPEVGISHQLTPLLSLAQDLCGISHFYAPPGALQQNVCLPAPGQWGQTPLRVVPSCQQSPAPLCQGSELHRDRAGRTGREGLQETPWKNQAQGGKRRRKKKKKKENKQQEDEVSQ